MAIQVYSYADTGAPTLNGTAGSLLNLFKKCLVDGYGDKDPLGWSGVYNAGYTKGYFTAPEGRRFPLWINDNGPNATYTYKSCRCRAYESIASMDGNGDPVSPGLAFPTTGQEANGGYINKSYLLDSTARYWYLIGDERCFYFLPVFCQGTSGITYESGVFFYGDFISFRPNDQFNVAFIPHKMESVPATGQVSGIGSLPFSVALSGSNTSPYHWHARRFDGSGGSCAAGHYYECMGNGSTSGAGTWGLTYPSPVDNSLILSRFTLHETSPYPMLRGILPGVFAPLHTRPMDHLATVDNVNGLPGRTMLCMGYGNGSSNYSGETYTGRLFFDITGPWF